MASEISLLQDRLQVAHLLAEKFFTYKNSDAVVVAVPRGGVPVGFELAQLLNLSFEIMPCMMIKHPAYGNQSIGSVSVDELVVNEDLRNIPQDYIYHQMILIQHMLKAKSSYYRGDRAAVSLARRTVILVDDLIQSVDNVVACVKSIKNKYASKIILAAAAATPEAAKVLSTEVDEFVLLQIEKSSHLQAMFPPVTDEEVKNLLKTS